VTCDFCNEKAVVIFAMTQDKRLLYLQLCLDCYFRLYSEEKPGWVRVFSIRAPEIRLN